MFRRQNWSIRLFIDYLLWTPACASGKYKRFLLYQLKVRLTVCGHHRDRCFSKYWCYRLFIHGRPLCFLKGVFYTKSVVGRLPVRQLDCYIYEFRARSAQRGVNVGNARGTGRGLRPAAAYPCNSYTAAAVSYVTRERKPKKNLEGIGRKNYETKDEKKSWEKAKSLEAIDFFAFPFVFFVLAGVQQTSLFFHVSHKSGIRGMRCFVVFRV